MEQEVLSLYYNFYDPSPHVDMEVQGVMTRFIVDTGTFLPCATFEQVKVWGLEDQIQYCDGDSYVWAQFRIKGRLMKIGVVVIRRYNLLGWNILAFFSSVLDLRANQLIFRDKMSQYELDKFDCSEITRVVTINGKEIEATVDTGSNFFLAGNLEDAQKLDLALEDISYMGIPFNGVDQKGILQYQCENVCLKAFGREVCGAFDVRPPSIEDDGVILGIYTLEGLVLRFNRNWQVDISLPEDDSEQAQDLDEQSRESAERRPRGVQDSDSTPSQGDVPEAARPQDSEHAGDRAFRVEQDPDDAPGREDAPGAPRPQDLEENPQDGRLRGEQDSSPERGDASEAPRP